MVRMAAICCGLVLTLAVGSTARAQTLQLPSRQVFSVNTSVLVPDRGGAYLGGVSRSSQGLTQRGPWRNRALGGSAGGVGASVHVTVIDHRALDRAVLAEAAERRAARSGESSAAAVGSPQTHRSPQTSAGTPQDVLARILAQHGEAQRRPSRQ